MTASKPHDTVKLKKGVYIIANLKINKPIVIIGEAGAEIEGEEKSQLFIIRADSVMISGLKFCNTGRSGMEDMAGIRLENTKAVSIMGNTFDNCFFGIFLAKSSNTVIRNNVFFGNENIKVEAGNGIHCWKGDSITIESNYVTRHRDGIYFEFVTNSIITSNYSFKNNRYGLHFMFSDDDVYRSNILVSNGAGVAVMYSKRIQMYHNRFMDNWGGSAYGLLLKDINDCIINNNFFINNTAGCYVEGSNRILFRSNRFEKNGWAVRLMANCVSDTFAGNTFAGNTFDFSTNGTLNNNRLYNNYWDKYQGYDLNRDGIGDVPYRPVSAYSVVVENVPMAMVFMRSMMTEMIDKTERVLPSLIPENIIDETPLMKQPL
ncbi:nitrous oxide reductase family maturation protein NosD [Oscillatoria amoena NRMC-F 0135]|nr:nitrous oxide reductase family maturation protein NosD [Oscillatoria amoena NRMC-F 0135]